MANPLTENYFKGMPKPALYASLAGGALITGYLVYSHHKKTGSWNPWSAGTTANAAGTAIDPVTGLPVSMDNVIDPATNLTYLQEAQQYGSVATAEASVSAYGTSVNSGSGIGVQPASPQLPTGNPGAVSSSTYTSNAAWAQAVEAGLQSISGSTSYDGTDIGEAIGAYLTGTPLTPEQIKVVNVAISEYGNPPVGTFQIIPAPTSGTGTTPASNFKVTIPNGQLGWETISFPTQSALDEFNHFLATDPRRSKRSAINAEITALGGSGEIPEPAGPDTAYPVGTPQNTGNPLDYQ